MKFYNEFYENLLNKIEITGEPREKIAELLKLLDEKNILGMKMESNVIKFMYPDAHDIRKRIEKIKVIAREYSVDENLLVFVFLLLSLKLLYKRYKMNGISDKIFFDSAKDLKCKLDECSDRYGYIGTFVPQWFERFFKAERFNIGRFQFEPTVIDEDIVTNNGVKIRGGTKAILMHIPSDGGSLTDEVRFSSYKKAYEFYSHFDFEKRKYFKDEIIKNEYINDEKIIFICHSWLFFNKHRDFLPENSNIIKFMNDFSIVNNHPTDVKENLWRIFKGDENLPLNLLPEDTLLKKEYKNWLLNGNGMEVGTGVMIFDYNERKKL